MNAASFAMSRLAMHRSSENNENNDIVSEFGIEGFGGKCAYGAPWFAVQGYSGFGDSFAATPAKEWDGLYEGRDTLSWQRGRLNPEQQAANGPSEEESALGAERHPNAISCRRRATE